ncbi:9908_t:CDS:2 [Ambispora gerdemannii]|uniref:9908_t:CDS:1 n=1 Tax=Ambispora gerdemannii TaxID=144530 RepID=A0A9N8ZRU9_9GLOM|nr:9908_t:CDS:2 [Ambispora gerdemannii]
MDKSYPRITAAQLHQNSGQVVSIVGRIVKVRIYSYLIMSREFDAETLRIAIVTATATYGTAVMKACDQALVKVKIVQAQNFQPGLFVEVTGRIGENLAIEEYHSINYDMNLYSRMIEISKKFTDIIF